MSKQNYDILLKNNWNDITIDDYYKLQSIENMVDIMSILTGEDKEVIEDMPLQVLNELISQTDFIHGDVPINDDIATELVKVRVEGGETVYYRLNLNVGEWESGRFMEFMEFSTDNETMSGNLHLLMVIACDKYKEVPGKWYKPWEISRLEKIPRSQRDLIEESKYALESFPISTTLSVLTFFLTTLESFSNDIVDSLDFTKIVMDSMVTMDTVIHQWNLENQASTKTSNGSSG